MNNRFRVIRCAAAGLISTSLAFGTCLSSLSQEKAPTDLASQLEKMSARAAERLPAEMLKTFEDAIETVHKSGIEKSAKQAGQPAVDAELTGWDGTKTQLSQLWKEGPIVLMWYRGGWCPYCSLQLRAMQQQLKTINGAGAKLVVLTPELPENAKATAAANDVDFVALHDAGNEVARKYGIVFALPDSIAPIYRDRMKLAEVNGHERMELPLSATYIIQQGGEIAYTFLNADYRKRAEPAEVVAKLKALTNAPSQPLSQPLEVGDSAPNFELESLDGKKLTLAESLKKGPVVLVVLRGFPGYQCPICSRQVAGLTADAKSFASKNATVLLVYPGPASELTERAKEFLRGAQLPDNFVMVTDPDYSFTNAYALRWKASSETAFPSSFVIGTDGIVRYAMVSTTHGGRSKAADLLDAIK